MVLDCFSGTGTVYVAGGEVSFEDVRVRLRSLFLIARAATGLCPWYSTGAAIN